MDILWDRVDSHGRKHCGLDCVLVAVSDGPQEATWKISGRVVR